MVAHDENIGRTLNKLDKLGIADDTIVMSSTDNGAHGSMRDLEEAGGGRNH